MYRGRIYIESSVVVDYIKMKITNDRDRKQFFGQEIPKLRDLQSKYVFVMLESTVGEVIGQCLNKGWKTQEVLDYFYEFLRVGREALIDIVRSDALGIEKDQLYEIFDRGRKILEREWSEGYRWGLDIYDVWFLSQVSLDSKARYIWSLDSRMLNYGGTYLEIVCGKNVPVVDSLRGIR